MMKQHECFEHPENQDIKVWRYMDFSKFVSLLETKSLFLSRVDKFDDPYEGARTHVNSDVDIRSNLYNDLSPDDLSKMSSAISIFMERCRSWTYVNCWHMNEHESDAMWRLYAKTNEAVAIQSTFRKVYNNVGSEAYVGVVKYIDYDKEWMPENNAFWPYVHKRLSFEHERELRVLIQNFPKNEGDESKFDFSKANNEYGKLISIDIQDMIEAVYVAPTSPKWFYEAVAGVIKRYEYDLQLKQSMLDKKPIY